MKTRYDVRTWDDKYAMAKDHYCCIGAFKMIRTVFKLRKEKYIRIERLELIGR